MASTSTLYTSKTTVIVPAQTDTAFTFQPNTTWAQAYSSGGASYWKQSDAAATGTNGSANPIPQGAAWVWNSERQTDPIIEAGRKIYFTTDAGATLTITERLASNAGV